MLKKISLPQQNPASFPAKIRPRRQKKHHHHHLGATGSAPGLSQPPRCTRSTPVKHPQHLVRPQHPQPPGPAANHYSARPDLLDQVELGRLYKPARPSISMITLEIIQNNAMRLMLGAPMWTRLCNLRAESNLPTLENRINVRNTCIISKAIQSERNSHTKIKVLNELPKHPELRTPNTLYKTISRLRTISKNGWCTGQIRN